MAFPSNRKWIEQSIEINASRDAIWQTIIGQDEFADWASIFQEGSRYQGEYRECSRISFIAGVGDEEMGMTVELTQYVPGVTMRTKVVSVVEHGKTLVEGPEFDEWAGIEEGYDITGESQPFTLSIRNEAPERFFENFESQWKNVLVRIKEIAESK